MADRTSAPLAQALRCSAATAAETLPPSGTPENLGLNLA
jgi:hypothetical protein